MNLIPAISPDFRSAMWLAIFLQVVVCPLTGLIFDGGDLFKIWVMTALAFGVGMMLVAFRRGMKPTRIDLVVIKYGFVPLFVFAIFEVYFVWRWRGVL